MENHSVNQGKTAAIVSHFWIIGLIIAFVMNLNKKNYFTSFYIRQTIGLNLIQFINGAIIYKYIGDTPGKIIWILLIIAWVISLVSAIKGEERELPYVGAYFQKWFNGI